MLPSSPSSLSLPLPGAETYAHSPYRRSLSANSHSPFHHHTRVPSLSRNPIRPTPRCYASFTVTDFAKTRTNSATAAIPPATFSSLPPADRRLLRRHTKLLWALSAGFFVCVIILTVSIVLAATEAKAPGGRVKWSVVVIGILGFVGAAVCVAFGWDAYRGRKARAERQETWVELEAESEERTRRERRRQRDVILDIRSRQQTPSLTRARPQSRGRARERDEEMGPGHRPQEITTIHKTHPSPSPNPNHLRRPYTRQNSISHPDPPNLNLKLDLDLTPFSRPSCDRLLATEREKQRLAQQAAQEMLSLYAQSAASAHNTASSLAHPSPNSTGHATSSPSPYSAPTDPWKIDIVPPRPGPRIQHRSAFRTPSSATPAENPFATPPPSESHGTAPPHHGPIIPTPTHHHHGHLFAMLALSTSPAADEACSETASVRERMRKQSVDRVQRWRARNEEMEGEERDGEGRAIRSVKGMVGLRGVLRRFQSS